MVKKIVAQNCTVLVGVDVHTKSHMVTVKVSGEIVGTWKMSANRDAWRSLLKRFPGCGLNVVYESGPTGYNPRDWRMELTEE